MRNKLFLVLAVILFLTAQAGATGINTFFPANAIKNKDGGVLADGNYHPYQAKLELFYNALPAPNSSAGRLTVDTATQYTLIGGQHKYQLASLDGGTLYVRVWNGTPATRGSYYGKASHGVASGTTLPYDWTISSLAADYKADVPYAPAIGAISESLRRTGTSYQLTLTVPISYNESGADGKREATGFSVEVVYPSGTVETRTGSSVTLTNTPAGTYRFTPTATNWFGSTTGSPVSYATLGAGGGVAGPVTYTLRKVADGLGLNAVAAIHNVPFSVDTAAAPTAVGTIAQLVAAVNAKSTRRDNVTAIGWMEDSVIKGFYVTYNAGGEPTFAPTSGLSADGSLALERGRSYQLSVNSDVTVTFSQ